MDKQQLDEEFIKLLEINEKFKKWENYVNEKIKGGKLFSLKLFEIRKKTPIDWNTLWVVSAIQTYTMTGDSEKLEFALEQAKKQGIIKSYEGKKIGYNIILADNTPVRFLPLTDFVPSLEEDVKTRLKSAKRLGHCHWDSVHLSKNLEMPNKIVSGLCTMQSKKMPFLHSWVELEYQEKKWVLDFSMNAVMNKEGYYNLYNPQNMVKIDNIALKEDIKLMESTSFEDEDIRKYLFFPTETYELMEKEIKTRKRYERGDFPYILVEK